MHLTMDEIHNYMENVILMGQTLGYKISNYQDKFVFIYYFANSEISHSLHIVNLNGKIYDMIIKENNIERIRINKPSLVIIDKLLELL